MASEKILIKGGSLGSFCLAQGLRRLGQSFILLESEEQAGDERGASSLRLDATDQEALGQCLPVDLLYLIHQSASLADSAPWFIDAAEHPLETGPAPSPPRGATGIVDLCVDARTLRAILSSGLDGYFHRAWPAGSIDAHSHEMVVCIADNMGVSGTMSAGMHPTDTAIGEASSTATLDGLCAITGRTPATASNCRAIGENLCAGTSVVVADGLSLWIDVMTFRGSMPVIAAAISPDCRLSPVEDYFSWTLSGPWERLGMFASSGTADAMPAVLARLAQRWSPALEALFLRSDPATCISHPSARLPAHSSPGTRHHVGGGIRTAADLVAHFAKVKRSGLKSGSPRARDLVLEWTWSAEASTSTGGGVSGIMSAAS